MSLDDLERRVKKIEAAGDADDSRGCLFVVFVAVSLALDWWYGWPLVSFILKPWAGT